MKLISCTGFSVAGMLLLLLATSCAGNSLSKQETTPVSASDSASPTLVKGEPTARGATNTRRQSIREAETVPVYPDAVNVTIEDPRVQHQPLDTEFKTAATPQDVASFYETALPALGWQIISVSTPGNLVLELSWPEEDSHAHKLELTIYIEMPHAGVDDPHPELTNVVISPRRVPRASGVPLYPGAQEIATSQSVDKYGFIELITSYSVDAAPQQIEEYYKQEMPVHGWQYGRGVRELSTIDKGLYFGYTDGKVHGGRQASATIVAESLPGKTTSVTVTAYGWDIGRVDTP